MKSILNVKTTLSDLIKIISNYNICSGIKSQQSKKKICHFDFSYNSSVLFHQVTFYRSVSCVLLIDKPNESCKNSIQFERNALSTTIKAFKKKIKKILHQQRQMPQFHKLL